MDIVERLRVHNARYGNLALHNAAADEIERLRAALLIARAWMPVVRPEMPHQNDLVNAHKIIKYALSDVPQSR